MARTVDVEVNAIGEIHVVAPAPAPPQGRALLTWQTSETKETVRLSETSLAEDWLRPEEDAAWAHLQPAR